MSKLDISWNKIKGLAAGLLASGKKNAQTLMTAGSVVMGWTAAYIFWKQGRKAEKKIEYEESLLNADLDSDTPLEDLRKLPVKEKFVIYLQYCWMAALLGVGSTGLAIGANGLNLSRLTEMALLTQFMTDKDDKQQKLIDKLKAEVGDKKFVEMKDELREEEYPKDEIMREILSEPANGKTLFIDQVTGQKFRASILDVTNGIAEFNERLKDRRKDAIRKRRGDAFYVSDDLPWGGNDEDVFSDVASSLDVEVFLKCIGEITGKNEARLGDLLEFRYYGGGDPIKANQILEYKNYVDPNSGFPVVCYIDYSELLAPSSELIERNDV
jgi:hypothetical protein